FSPEGGRVVTVSEDRTARVWDAATGQPLTSPLKHDMWPVPRFSPDGRWVLTRDGRTARVWDAATGDPVTPVLRPRDGHFVQSFSAEGRHVVTSSRDGTAQVWEMAMGRPVTPPLPCSGGGFAAFSPDGRRVLTINGDAGQNGTVRIWNLVTGQPTAISRSALCLFNEIRFLGVRQAAFSPDGPRVLTPDLLATHHLCHAAT